MTFRLTDVQKRALWLSAIWFVPLVDICLAIHAQLSGPWMGERTGWGRWERLENPWPFCAILLLGALWLTVRRFHTERKLQLFMLLAFCGFLADASFFGTVFGSSLLILGAGAQYLALGLRRAGARASIPNSLCCEGCGAPLPVIGAICDVCDKALRQAGRSDKP